MKKLFLLMLIITLFLSGCSTIDVKRYTYMDAPEEINLYHRGDVLNLQKNSDKYDVMLSFINKAIADTENTGVMKQIRRSLDEEGIKATGYALELVYENPINPQLLINGRKQEKIFDRVLIPLDDNIIFVGGEEGYSPRGLTISFVPKEFIFILLGYEVI